MARSNSVQFSCLSALAASLLAASPAFADRPLAIDSAKPVGPGAYQAEAGLRFSQGPGQRHADLPIGLTYGLIPRLEVGAGWGWHLRDRVAGNADALSGQQDFSLGFSSGNYDQIFDLTQATSYGTNFLANHGSVGNAMNALVNGAADGTSYLNIHSNAYPGGEIRGFLAPVPEPASYVLMAVGLLGLAGLRRNQR